MTRDEARALLVEQGALMLEARLRATAAQQAMKEARSAWVEAAALLVTDEFCEHEFTLGEEKACFEESLDMIGRRPDDPEFALERKAFRRQQETALEGQREWAGLN